MATATVDIGTLIVRTPGTLGGRPRIEGTRIGVDHVAVLWSQGYSAEDIVYTKYDHLTLGQVYAALAYYHSNKEAIDASIAAEAALYDRLAREHAISEKRPRPS